jgi:peroxiredoxin Q/BCP
MSGCQAETANDLPMTEPQPEFKEGDPAPPFDAPGSAGGNISLAALRGKNVILFFYPKDNTPGCTIEACALRDSYEELKKHAVVLGVSTDSLKSHEKFTRKFSLPFPLLADEEKKIVQAYGVWGPKKFMGVKYMGTSRSTFWIGPDGRIKKIWAQVRPAGHAAEILAALRGEA